MSSAIEVAPAPRTSRTAGRRPSPLWLVLVATALQTSPWTLAPMIVAPLAGFIAPRVGTRALIVTGLLALGVALFWLSGLLDADIAYPTYVPPFILAGVGMGLVFAPSATAVLATMAPHDHAKASGTNSMLREVGVALGIAVSTAVFTGAGGQLNPVDYAVGAEPAVLVGAAVLVASALIAMLLPSGKAAKAAAVAEPDAIAEPGAIADEVDAPVPLGEPVH